MPRKPNNKKASAFCAWFEAQAGKGPTVQDTIDLRSKVTDKRTEYACAEQELVNAERYQLIKQYALYAWCAGVAHGRRQACRRARR